MSLSYHCTMTSWLDRTVTASRKLDWTHWVISSNLNCVLVVGWCTSTKPILMGWLLQHSQWEKNFWCFLIELLMLMVCMLTDCMWRGFLLASFIILQWILFSTRRCIYRNEGRLLQVAVATCKPSWQPFWRTSKGFRAPVVAQRPGSSSANPGTKRTLEERPRTRLALRTQAAAAPPAGLQQLLPHLWRGACSCTCCCWISPQPSRKGRGAGW